MKHLKRITASVLLLSTSNVWAQEKLTTQMRDLERVFSENDQKYERKYQQEPEKEGTRHFDSYFYYETEPEGEYVDVTAFSINDTFKGRLMEYNRVVDLYKAAFGLDNQTFSKARSYNESLSLLSQQASSLTQDQKLLFLSLSGSRLSGFYSQSESNKNTSEELFQNSLSSGNEGGICGDIHKYLAGQAKALGFTDVGLHTGIWQKDKKGQDSGGHFIYHFRDPKTGEYYIQNYSQVINTGQKSQQSMLEVSNRVLGPLVGTVYTEGNRGDFHAYIPQTSLWIQEGLKELAYAGKEDSILQMRIGNQSNSVGMQVVKQDASGSYLRAFMLHQKYSSEEGVYQFSGAGLASGASVSIYTDTLVDEFGLSARGYVAAGQVGAPTINNEMEWEQKQRNVFLSNMQVRGTARVNRTTGRVELETSSIDRNLKSPKDMSAPDMSVKVGSSYSSGSVTVDHERTYRRVKDGHYSSTSKWVTESDKISLIFDKQIGKVYLLVRGELYLFEGVETMAAQAVKNAVEASYPAGSLGEVYIAMDVAKVVGNKSGDPFYDIPASSEFKVGLKRDFAKFVQAGAEVSYRKGRRVYPLYKEEISPGLESDNAKGFGGLIWMSLKW
nr:hypothetical protein [uncultured Bdellovibrio sp.]